MTGVDRHPLRFYRGCACVSTGQQDVSNATAGLDESGRGPSWARLCTGVCPYHVFCTSGSDFMCDEDRRGSRSTTIRLLAG